MPITVFASLAAVMFDLKAKWPPLRFSLLIGTPVLSLLGALARRSRLGSGRRVNLATSLLVLPLYGADFRCRCGGSGGGCGFPRGLSADYRGAFAFCSRDRPWAARRL
ncbi:MAG: heme exporter protein CcmB [Dakarella massiliensis]